MNMKVQKDRPEVKVKVQLHLWTRCMQFVDSKPRLGWYLTLLLFLNYVIDALQSIL